MSNNSDPKPNPEQPDPKKSDEGQSGRTPGGSAFDFKLPDDGSFSDLPPIPQPPESTTRPPHTVLPPRPSTIKPSSDSFDFIDLGDVDPSMMPPSTVQKLPPAPPLPPVASAPEPRLPSPSDDAITIPPVSAPGDSSVTFSLPVPTDQPSSFTLGGDALDLTNLPKLPELPVDGPASEIMSAPDIGTLYPTDDPPSSYALGSELPTVPAKLDSSGSFVLPPELSTPSTPDIASVFPQANIPAADPGSFVGDPAIADLELPLATSGSSVISSHPPTTATPTPNLDSVVGLSTAPTGEPGSDVITTNMPVATPTPNLDSAILGATPVMPVSGWLGYSRVRGAKAEAEATAEAIPIAEEIPPATPVAGHEPTGRSSFDFALPEGVTTFSDMPAPQQPDANDQSDTHAALPPRPVANRVDSQTFDLIDIVDDEPAASGSGVGLPSKASALPAPPGPVLTPTDGVIHLPPAHDPEAVVGNLEPVDPVAPASGWLDSDVLRIPTADPNALIPTAEPAASDLEPVTADVIESSDIFSGGRAIPALPVEQSDVIVATAYGSAIPADAKHLVADVVEPTRPSDIALNFESPPGGSTLSEGASAELPIADEITDSSLLAMPVTEGESILDMPGVVVTDALFDSALLSELPDLPPAAPAVPPRATIGDSTDYGSTPVLSADASSILADLHDPINSTGADSSSVRVEAPGVDRTLTGSPAEGAFDLTVSDEPIPADLFGEPSEGTATESIDWQSQAVPTCSRRVAPRRKSTSPRIAREQSNRWTPISLAISRR